MAIRLSLCPKGCCANANTSHGSLSVSQSITYTLTQTPIGTRLSPTLFPTHSTQLNSLNHSLTSRFPQSISSPPHIFFHGPQKIIEGTKSGQRQKGENSQSNCPISYKEGVLLCFAMSSMGHGQQSRAEQSIGINQCSIANPIKKQLKKKQEVPMSILIFGHVSGNTK